MRLLQNDSGREPCGSEDCLVQWYHDWVSGHINESTLALHKPFVLGKGGASTQTAPYLMD